ncbi:MAG: ribosome maturation factor RimM [Burkholderiales bacterium]|nr:ribosome maturation factor RimM [Burkholderiales bacterium]MDE2159354.1 ribosome maturation factor RimM [Burkholderiales bacterium]MDE2504911.1 ribosome maturation factor RimM [Burkholderiales bacterium]
MSPDAGTVPDDAVEVGRIVGAWGIKGALKVLPYASDPQALFSSRRWYILPPEAAAGVPASKRASPWPTLLRVVGAKEHGDGVVATVHDIADRDAAEALKGARVLVPRSSFPTPGDGEFYWVDLIGLAVRNRAAVELGSVVGLLETGPHCVLRVRGAASDAGEILIPFVDAYVDGVDLAARRITVDWEADY